MGELVDMRNPFAGQAPVARNSVHEAAWNAAPDDTILRVKKHFGGERVYSYSMIKAGGKWYVTGQVHAGRGLTARQVFAFLQEGTLVSVEMASTFQKIDV